MRPARMGVSVRASRSMSKIADDISEDYLPSMRYLIVCMLRRCARSSALAATSRLVEIAGHNL